jgi:4-carboxymuconolactone decarboxylase
MPETPTFGRYAEIPYDEMTPEQQEGYHSLLETRGPLGGPRKIWVHNPKLAKGGWTSRRAFSSRALLVDRART